MSRTGTFSGAGGSTFLPVVAGVVDGINTIFTFSIEPSVVVRDGVSMQKVSEDTTVNWTGTTTITLSIAPNSDLFGLQ